MTPVMLLLELVALVRLPRSCWMEAVLDGDYGGREEYGPGELGRQEAVP